MNLPAVGVLEIKLSITQWISPAIVILLVVVLATSVDARVVDTGVPGDTTEMATSRDLALEGKILEVIQSSNGSYGVAIRSLRDGHTLAVNAETSLSAASLYKLLVAYEVYYQIEAGALSPDDPISITDEDTITSVPGDDLDPGYQLTVADALHAMLTWSSNAAALALVRVSGGWDEVLYSANRAGVQLGVSDDQFWIRPVDLLTFYDELFRGGLLDQTQSNQFVAQLLEQEKKDRIPALLPDGTPIAHKTGELENVRNDAGIVVGPHGGYVIVLMASGADPDEEVQVEAKISELVYQQYGQ